MASIANKVFQKNGEFYWADKSYVSYVGIETMIFRCDKNGEVENWTELYCDKTNMDLEECIQEFLEQ